MSANVTYFERDNLLAAGTAHMCPATSVLDIGCGIRPQSYVQPFLHFCCDPYAEYVTVLRKRLADVGDRIWIVLNMGWTEVVQSFPPGSVDSIYLVDVIEHLEKDAGAELLRKTIALQPRQIVIFTPLGFMPQHHDAGRDVWGLGGAQWQEHHSGWMPEDFDASWETLVCADFHLHDNQGRLLEKPVGAFWALWNNPNPAEVAQPPMSEFARWRVLIEMMNRTNDERYAKQQQELVSERRERIRLTQNVYELQTELGNTMEKRLTRLLKRSKRFA